jgi:hypothetical protein
MFFCVWAGIVDAKPTQAPAASIADDPNPEIAPPDPEAGAQPGEETISRRAFQPKIEE